MTVRLFPSIRTLRCHVWSCGGFGSGNTAAATAQQISNRYSALSTSVGVFQRALSRTSAFAAAIPGLQAVTAPLLAQVHSLHGFAAAVAQLSTTASVTWCRTTASTLPASWPASVVTTALAATAALIAQEAALYQQTTSFKGACVSAKAQFFYKTRPLTASAALAVALPTCANPAVRAPLGGCTWMASHNRCCTSFVRAVPPECPSAALPPPAAPGTRVLHQNQFLDVITVLTDEN